jgi:hypothetical protein
MGFYLAGCADLGDEGVRDVSSAFVTCAAFDVNGFLNLSIMA